MSNLVLDLDVPAGLCEITSQLWSTVWNLHRCDVETQKPGLQESRRNFVSRSEAFKTVNICIIYYRFYVLNEGERRDTILNRVIKLWHWVKPCKTQITFLSVFRCLKTCLDGIFNNQI